MEDGKVEINEADGSWKGDAGTEERVSLLGPISGDMWNGLPTGLFEKDVFAEAGSEGDAGFEKSFWPWNLEQGPVEGKNCDRIGK